MNLTPEGLAQPLAPGVQTSFPGAGAPAAVQQASGPFVVPIKTGICAIPSFEPIFSATCPLPRKELDFVVNGLNTALAKSKCCGFGLYLLITLCYFGSFLGEFDPFDDDGSLGIALLNASVALFAVGSFGVISMFVCVFGAQEPLPLTDIQRELSELNAQYNPRGIDFQLIEWHEFVLLAGLPNTGYGPQMAGYGPQMAGHSPQMTFRQVWKHALLIRTLQPEMPDFDPSAPP